MTARWWTVLLLFVLLAGIGLHASPPVKHDAYVPAYGPQYSQNDDYLKQILEELKGLRKDVQGLKQQQANPQEGATGVIAARCLGCHQDGKAQDKGGAFVLVEKDGTMSELSLAEKRRIVRMVGKGEMPPGGKLADTEIKVLSDYFTPKEEQKK